MISPRHTDLPASSSAPAHSLASLAALVDHTLLKPNARVQEIEQLCLDAIAWNFHSVCVPPCYLALSHSLVKGSAVKLATVVGFPHGNARKEVKMMEAEFALAAGCEELDVVGPIWAMAQDNFQPLIEELAALSQLAKNVQIKMILETGYLTPAQIHQCCLLVQMHGGHFVKTSTGYGPRGATLDDIRAMRATVGPEFGVKASGGIRTLEAFLAMIAAGASRVGLSASVEIFEKLEGNL